MKQNKQSWQMIRSISYSFKGLRFAFKTQPNFRIECVSAILVLTSGFIFGLTAYEWVVISLCIGAVCAAELVNTAIEKLVDMVQPDFDAKAGLVKDLSSAMVLVVAIGSAACGLIIFLPKFF